ncbi:CRISPR-associated endonuclease Cas3'' [Candidatus Harpocratesius sp.]
METRLYSHPNIKLEDHLSQVTLQMDKNLQQIDFSNFPISIEIARIFSFIIGIFHDFGKCSSYFQVHLNKNQKIQYSHHSPISAFVGAHFVEWFLNLEEIKKNIVKQKSQCMTDNFDYQILIIIAFITIRRHHSNLQSILTELDDDMVIQQHEANEFEYIAKDLMKKERISQIKDLYHRILIQFQETVPCLYNHKEDFINEIENALRKIDSHEKIRVIIKSLRIKFKKYLRNMKKSSKITQELILFNYSLLNFIFSSLIDSDKLIAAGISTYSITRREIPDNAVDEYKKYLFGDKVSSNFDKFREEFYCDSLNSLTQLNDDELYKQRIFSLTAPTGIGKTFTVLSFALKLRARLKTLNNCKISNNRSAINNNNIEEFSPRIIYCLPFTSIIDQNYLEIEKILQISILDFQSNQHEYLLKIHHLSEILYKTNDNELPNDQALLLTESWNSEIIVTTFYQVFYTLFGYQNRQLKKFHRLTNSILIFDEIQAFPPDYWIPLRYILLTMSKFFNLRVIFLTATQPAIMEKGEILEINPKIEYYFKSPFLNRINFIYSFNGVNYLSNYLNKMDINRLKQKSTIFVANTIRTSLQIVKFLLNTLENAVPINEIESRIKEEVKINFNENFLIKKGNREKIISILSNYKNKSIIVYLSSMIIPHQRKIRIQLLSLINQLKIHSITVSTQVIEAGVDIDAELIIRDFAPLDSLIQVSGRCNRNAKNDSFHRGNVEINYWKNPAHKNRPYCSYIYNDNLLTATKSILEEEKKIQKLPWSENVFLPLSKAYFNSIKELISSNSELRDSKVSILLNLAYSRNRNLGKRNEILYIQDFELIPKEYIKHDILIILDENTKMLFQDYCNKINDLYKAKNRNFKERMQRKIDVLNQLRKLRQFFVPIYHKDYEKIKGKLKNKANICYIPLCETGLYHPLYGIDIVNKIKDIL